MMTLKSLFVLVTAIAQHYAITAPNARPRTEELREQHGSEHMIPYFTASVKILTWSWAILESAVLFVLSDYCPSVLADSLTSELSSLTTPTYALVTGTLFSISGALLRAHTFRVLGTRFTFELSIRGSTSTPAPVLSQSHTLVTDGIYSVVRHPSYTGGILLALGFLLCLFDRQGSAVVATAAVLKWCCWHGFTYGSRERFGFGDVGDMDMSTLVTTALACAWTTAVAILSVGLHARMNKEDAMLEAHFGEVWRAWVERVPSRLVPGVY